jgi:hypothetical protein
VSFMVVLGLAFLKEWTEVLAVLNFLCFQNLAAKDFDCPLAVFLNHPRIGFPKIVHLC